MCVVVVLIQQFQRGKPQLCLEMERRAGGVISSAALSVVNQHHHLHTPSAIEAASDNNTRNAVSSLLNLSYPSTVVPVSAHQQVDVALMRSHQAVEFINGTHNNLTANQNFLVQNNLHPIMVRSNRMVPPESYGVPSVPHMLLSSTPQSALEQQILEWQRRMSNSSQSLRHDAYGTFPC